MLVTNRMAACDFLLANNTNFHPIAHRFPVIVQYSSNIIAFDKGVALVDALVLSNICDHRHK